MLPSFQEEKEIIKINPTTEGEHGDHWYAFSDEIDQPEIMDLFQETFKKGKQLVINKDLTIITGDMIREIIYKGYLLSAFPYCKGSKYENFETYSIIEWTHTDNLEAIIKVTHSNRYDIGFFATDYSFNKDIYQKQKNLSINLIGMAYSLKDFDVKWYEEGEGGLRFGHDFCAYMPHGKDILDLITFYGLIQNIKEYNWGEIPGFIITVKINPDFNLDIFIAKSKLQTTLELNKHIEGVAWVQGTLEK